MMQTDSHEVPAAGADPLIDEVRAIRRRISERFDNDVDRLVEHLRKVECAQPEWVVTRESVDNRP